jgi:hypothetical protein
MSGRWFGCGWAAVGVVSPWRPGGMVRALLAERAANGQSAALPRMPSKPSKRREANGEGTRAVRILGATWFARFGRHPTRSDFPGLVSEPDTEGYSRRWNGEDLRMLLQRLALDPEATCAPRSATLALRIFSAIWPADLPWPADVPRPDPTELDAR